MIKIIEEMSLDEFYCQAWSGGLYTLKVLTNDEIDVLDAHIEELYPDGLTDTELNDFLWFERDLIAKLLGFEDWDTLEEDHENEE